jgi:hypothetical protein
VGVFYESLIEKAALARTERLRAARVGPGLCAECADYALSVEIYEHKDLVFWTVVLNRSSPRRRRIRTQGPFQLVGQSDDRVMLRQETALRSPW